jgi:hypothetical protein
MSCIHCSKPTKGEKFCPACGGLQPGVAPSALSGTSGGAKAGILKAQPQSAFKSGTILQAAPPARASGMLLFVPTFESTINLCGDFCSDVFVFEKEQCQRPVPSLTSPTRPLRIQQELRQQSRNNTVSRLFSFLFIVRNELLVQELESGKRSHVIVVAN